jgi:hypothetical protein
VDGDYELLKALGSIDDEETEIVDGYDKIDISGDRSHMAKFSSRSMLSQLLFGFYYDKETSSTNSHKAYTIRMNLLIDFFIQNSK